MAECLECHQEMRIAGSCTETAMFLVDAWYERITYGSTQEDIPAAFRARLPDRCGDCGTRVGGFHHPGCDMERCPRCGDQALGCECQDDEEDEDDE